MTLFRVEGDKNYETLEVENGFVIDLQVEIERAMDEVNISQAELARRLAVSEARVSQILGGNGKNLGARTLARIAAALGRKPRFNLEGTQCSKGEGQFEARHVRRMEWADVLLSEAQRGWTPECNDNDTRPAVKKSRDLARYAKVEFQAA